MLSIAQVRMEIKKGESLASYHLRKNIVFYRNDVAKVASKVLRGQNFAWEKFFIFPVHSDESKRSFSFRDSKIILDNHTLVPLYRPLLSLDSYVKLVSGTFFNNIYKPVQARYIEGFESNLRDISFCISCLKEHCENDGFLWFKTEWQLHEVEICKRHNERLVSSHCERCGSKFSYPANMLISLFRGECLFCSASIFNEGSFRKVDGNHHSRWYSKFKDESIFSKKYRNFSRTLIEKIVRDSSDLIREKQQLAKWHSPLRHSLYLHADLDGVIRYMKRRSDVMPHAAFWSLTKSAFGSLHRFDHYLKEASVSKTYDSKKILPDCPVSFKVQQLDAR